MKRHPHTGFALTLVFTGALLAFCLNGCSFFHTDTAIPGDQSPDTGPWPEPVSLPLRDSLLEPGLNAYYFKKKIRHLRDMPARQAMIEKGRRGEPILRLAHRFGAGEVFGSGESHGICVQMTGLIQFAEKGAYRLKARSNDGVRLAIDQRIVLDDPDVHSDRWTPTTVVNIRQPGWYSIEVRYFQRKGTATLELYWQKPDDSSFALVPASAYAHRSPTGE